MLLALCVSPLKLFGLHKCAATSMYCSFTADLSVICSYVCLIDDDCSAVGVLGKFPVYSALSPQPAPICRQFDLYWHPRCFTPVRSNWECVGLSHSASKFLHITRETASQMWIQILQAHIFKAFTQFSAHAPTSSC